MDFDMGPGISNFWMGNVMYEEVVQDLGSVLKQGLCFGGYD